MRIKNKRDKIKTWTFPVFSNYQIRVVVSNDIKKALTKFEHTKHVELRETTDALTVHAREAGVSYIFIEYKASIGTTVHEAYHAVRQMLLSHDVDLTDSEVVAYHLGYLSQQISDWRWSWK